MILIHDFKSRLSCLSSQLSHDMSDTIRSSYLWMRIFIFGSYDLIHYWFLVNRVPIIFWQAQKIFFKSKIKKKNWSVFIDHQLDNFDNEFKEIYELTAFKHIMWVNRVLTRVDRHDQQVDFARNDFFPELLSLELLIKFFFIKFVFPVYRFDESSLSNFEYIHG